MQPAVHAEQWLKVATAAVAAIATRLGPRGQWPGWVCADADPQGSGRLDLAAPITALGMLALRGLTLPGAQEVTARSAVHLQLTVLPGGLWRYYANIPPDTDDTAMCALALGADHPAVTGQTAASLADTRLADGLFPTWFEPGWDAVVDPVANAHVVAVIGPGFVTEAAVAWLGEVVADGREVAESAYYICDLDLHVAITRAVEAGVESLRPAAEAARRRARDRLAEGDMTAYRTAQAMVVEGHGSDPDPELLAKGARALIGSRQASGLWPSDSLFVATNTTAPGLWHYGSDAVTSALCARALTVASRVVTAP